MKGFQGLLDFLEHLKKAAIPVHITQHSSDAISVCYATLGHRFEVEFFADHIEYSIFSGDESVETDEKKLYAMIEEFQ